MFWFLLLLLLVVAGGGFYLYQKLLTIEREIRQEQTVLAGDDDNGNGEESVGEAPAEEKAQAETEEATEVGLEERLLAAVAQQPGLLQTELYRLFPDRDRKQLQQLLRSLAKEGKLKREKEKSSYRLLPS